MPDQQKFYVSHEGKQTGPYSLSEIINKVKSLELSPMDYLYDDGQEDWVALMEHSELSSKMTELKPKTPPKEKKEPKAKRSMAAAKGKKGAAPTETTEGSMTQDWYVLKGENKFGPFSYPDVIKMLQEKVVFEFDFAWHAGLETWVRIAELDSFDKEKIKTLKDTLMPEIKEVFFRRRYRRAKYGGTIIIHDNQKLWKGEAVEISAGGAGIIMENSMIVPGQMLYLHFKPGDGVPPFNAICEVVSKRFVDGVKDKTAPIHYGLKFKSISPNTQKFLQDYAKKAEAA